jgi:hypothetical protein
MQIPQFNVPEARAPKCGADEEYRTCGSACIPTCAMPLPKPWCTRHCAVGCYCKEGYLRNEQNVCVPAAKCKTAALPIGPGPVVFPTPEIALQQLEPINIPLQMISVSPICPKNEEYNTCGIQFNCLASCKTPVTPECMERMCTPGCVCQKPLVRHADGRCVEKTECPKN